MDSELVSIRRASRIGLFLGATFLLAGALSLAEYISTGTVRLEKESTTLFGLGALTVPVAWLLGGIWFASFGLYFRKKLRRLEQAKERRAAA